MARIPAAQENTMLDAGFVPSTTYYLSLNTGDPGQTGANEAAVTRQAITFGASALGVKVSTNSQTFTSLPAAAGGLPYYSVWTLASGGTYLGGGATTGLSGSIPSGASCTAATGQVSWTLS